MASQLQPVVLTRALADAVAWTKALSARHYDVLHLPLMVVQAAQPSTALLQTCSDIHNHTALMFVSANAVRFFFECASAEALRCITDPGSVAPGPRCWAPGPGTAAELLRFGVAPGRVDQPQANAAQFDSEALWQVVGQQVAAGSRVLIVRGHTASSADVNGEGRQWLAQQCQANGAAVEFAVVYQRMAPDFNAGTGDVLDRCAQMPHAVWLASSSEGLRHLQTLMIAWGGPSAALHAQRLVVTHPRIAQQAQALGWQRVHTTKPALPHVLQTLAMLPSE